MCIPRFSSHVLLADDSVIWTAIHLSTSVYLASQGVCHVGHVLHISACAMTSEDTCVPDKLMAN